jgi:hypothetical protein
MRPSEQRSGGEQQLASGRCMRAHWQRAHFHLRRNSGAIARSAKA